MFNLKDKVVLIGMPGCGKTTIGKMLAERLKYKFYDMDEYIENISGKSVKELFAKSEENFRNWESKACLELSKEIRVVISSGGGVIKREKNMDLFREESIIVFIDRPIENIISDIDSASRPLLASGKEKLYSLLEERYDLYNKYCHIRIDNDGLLTDVVLEIEKELDKLICASGVTPV